MNKQKIAFDIDETLIGMDNAPKYWVIDLLLWFKKIGWDVIIWSSGGVDYAETITRKLGFEGQVRVIAKGSEKVDIAVDDMADNLAKTDITKQIAKVIIKV